MQPDVSVIIPVYNMEHTLRRAVESVFSVKNIPLEIIVVDDGSTDQSGRVIKLLKSEADEYPNITFITDRIENSGRGVALNRGISFASGSLVCFLDGDDQIDPAQFSLFYDCTKKEKSDLSIGGFSTVKADTNERSDRKPGLSWTKKQISNKIVFSPLSPIHLNATMTDLGLLKKTGGFDESLIRSQDKDMALRLLSAAQSLTVCDSVHYLYFKWPLTRKQIVKKRAQWFRYRNRLMWKNLAPVKAGMAILLHAVYDLLKLCYELILGVVKK